MEQAEKEDKCGQKEEYPGVKIEVITWPYVDIVSISGGNGNPYQTPSVWN